MFIAWHLGLGDAIACAAIVAKMAESGEEVIVPSLAHNEASVKSFFVNIPNVKVVVVESDKWSHMEIDHNFVRLGYYNEDLPQLSGEDFVQWFYRQAGMDISEKEKYCPIKKASEQFIILGHDITGKSFVHQDYSRGFVVRLPEYFGIRPYFDPEENAYSILVHAKALLTAKEVHCIDSSFLHLCEALNVPGEKVYHKYARPYSTDFKYTKGWKIMN